MHSHRSISCFYMHNIFFNPIIIRIFVWIMATHLCIALFILVLSPQSSSLVPSYTRNAHTSHRNATYPATYKRNLKCGITTRRKDRIELDAAVDLTSYCSRLRVRAFHVFHSVIRIFRMRKWRTKEKKCQSVHFG